MRKLIAVLLCLSLAPCGQVLAEGTLHPVKISQSQLAGEIFKQREPVVQTHDGNTTHDVEVFRTDDEKFDVGVWDSGAARMEINTPYPYNEYMHLLKGSVTLTSADGQVTEVNAGESVILPMGWTGIWDTPGCLKVYVIYAPDKNL